MADERKARRQRRSFSDAFRAGAVRLVLDEGKSINQVAKDLDLTASALGEWVARAKADRTKGRSGGLTTGEPMTYGGRGNGGETDCPMEDASPRESATTHPGRRLVARKVDGPPGLAAWWADARAR